MNIDSNWIITGVNGILLAALTWGARVFITRMQRELDDLQRTRKLINENSEKITRVLHQIYSLEKDFGDRLDKLQGAVERTALLIKWRKKELSNLMDQLRMSNNKLEAHKKLFQKTNEIFKNHNKVIRNHTTRLDKIENYIHPVGNDYIMIKKTQKKD